MTHRARRRFALLGATVHGAILVVVVWLARGFDALSVAATWLAIAGSSLALSSETAHQRRDDVAGQPLLETLTGLMVLTLVVSAALAADASRWLLGGAVLMLAGIALRAAAQRSLGAAFGTRPRPGDPLVEDGVYAWFRHPSEIGLLLLGGGLALLADGMGAGAIWLALAVLAVVRVRREDAELERRHGERYRRYRRRRAPWGLSRSSARG